MREAICSPLHHLSSESEGRNQGNILTSNMLHLGLRSRIHWLFPNVFKSTPCRLAYVEIHLLYRKYQHLPSESLIYLPWISSSSVNYLCDKTRHSLCPFLFCYKNKYDSWIEISPLQTGFFVRAIKARAPSILWHNTGIGVLPPLWDWVFCVVIIYWDSVLLKPCLVR